VTLGQHVAAMTKHCGVNEKLVVSTADQAHISSMTADGVRFTLDGNVTDLKFADHDIQKRFGSLEGQITEVLKRCESHPGFQDAVARGLRVMTKR